MIAKDTPMSDEWAVEAGQQSGQAPSETDAGTVGYFEPHQLTKLAQNGRLYVIADSVGGSASGQVAGQYAVKQILYRYYNSDNPDLMARLLAVIQQTNREIYERNLEFPQRRVMGATVMAALVHDNKLLVASVGDSRVYVVWDQDSEWLNGPGAPDEADPAGPAATSPKLLPAEIPSVAESSPLAPPRPPAERAPAALGLEETVKVETFSRRLFAGDIIVLISGGLTGYVTEQEIARAMTKHAPDQAIRRLIALANERGNRSHIAISVSRVLSSPVAMRSPLPMVMPKAPSWSDWEKPPKPDAAGEKPPTRPLSKPIPVTSPVTTALSKPTSVEIPLNKPYQGQSRSCLVTIVLSLLICAGLVLTLPTFLSAEQLAAVPFLADWGLAPSQPAESEEAAEPVDPAGPTPLAAEAGNPQPAATAPLAAENSSLLATPTPLGASQAPTTILAGPTPTTIVVGETADTIIIDTPTPSPTPAPTIVLPANCESKARFVSDVTVEDGTQFEPASRFDKVWRLRNEGSCPWGPGFTVRFLNSDYFGAANQVPLTTVVNPDETTDLTVPMIAPTELGEYRGVWQMFDLAGQPFGPTMFLEIEVVPVGAVVATGATANDNTVYDFVANAPQASWSSGPATYLVQATTISEEMPLPETNGLVAIGPALLRGNVESQGEVLLTYPHQELGFIEGSYAVDVPLQPGDALAASLGFTRLSILSDDGVTFEVSFTPNDGSGQVLTLLSQRVVYRDSPISQLFPLTDIQAGQSGTFTLRVLGGASTSRDWAVWIDLRLIRP